MYWNDDEPAAAELKVTASEDQVDVNGSRGG